MPKRSLRHRPVLYLKCADFTMALLELADRAELERFVRIYVCRTEGRGHYLIVVPYEKRDLGKTQDPEEWYRILTEWESKVAKWFADHGKQVSEITIEEARKVAMIYDDPVLQRSMINRYKIGSNEEWEELFFELLHDEFFHDRWYLRRDIKEAERAKEKGI